MRTVKTLITAISVLTLASTAFAGTPTLAGAPSHSPNYKMENGIKVYRVMTSNSANPAYSSEVRRINSHQGSQSYQTTIENGVTVHRLMPAPKFYSAPYEFGSSPSFDRQIRKIKKRARKDEKKAFQRGYEEGYSDGYQSASENQRFRRPIRLRQRIRTRPRVSREVLRRRNLQ